MADLYGGAPSSPATEPEEISSLLHQLLHQHHDSSAAAAAAASGSAPPPHLPPPPSAAVELLPDRHRFGLSELELSNNFSDPSGYSNVAASKRRGGGGVSVENDFGCDSEKGTEAAPEEVRHKSSSKRSRTAEVHNLSEKRRRSRINEKMKALQNLIPNSNKTDKASMLDEAIEYLKQLQLQVQMLTMRNGLSLHPMCLQGALPPMQVPLSGVNFDQGNALLHTNPVTGTFPANDDNSVQPIVPVNLPNQCRMPNQSILMPSVTSIPSSGTLGFEPIGQLNYASLNLATSSKEICREGTSQPPLTMNQLMNASSSSASY